ncbi:hypothetical protein GN958_ATG10940 [Phytophthora infestans]|uniref:Uncharacterized protein n=1 Tax=Phytophthora infestans TaxID=4787 RepID=A0A8S9UK53_PHYIN|nr:hypothetical protein GN958_ATG19316 [Phytophthora infestans]KAF4139867.1 hypothetical protein GN958_ATG10940 [Phytophthora infestans]
MYFDVTAYSSDFHREACALHAYAFEKEKRGENHAVLKAWNPPYRQPRPEVQELTPICREWH